jgi:5-methyltetrahydropteroyltriglutamate--homocysteine methyltransferase
VIAGSDCGFGTFAGYRILHPTTSWMKLRALTAGARLASRQLWGDKGYSDVAVERVRL